MSAEDFQHLVERVDDLEERLNNFETRSGRSSDDRRPFDARKSTDRRLADLARRLESKGEWGMRTGRSLAVRILLMAGASALLGIVLAGCDERKGWVLWEGDAPIGYWALEEFGTLKGCKEALKKHWEESERKLKGTGIALNGLQCLPAGTKP